jgi:hypothetical protein
MSQPRLIEEYDDNGRRAYVYEDDNGRHKTYTRPPFLGVELDRYGTGRGLPCRCSAAPFRHHYDGRVCAR